MHVYACVCECRLCRFLCVCMLACVRGAYIAESLCWWAKTDNETRSPAVSGRHQSVSDPSIYMDQGRVACTSRSRKVDVPTTLPYKKRTRARLACNDVTALLGIKHQSKNVRGRAEARNDVTALLMSSGIKHQSESVCGRAKACNDVTALLMSPGIKHESKNACGRVKAHNDVTLLMSPGQRSIEAGCC